MSFLSLPDILDRCGFQAREKIKFYRHGNEKRILEDHGRGFEEIYQAGELDLYQSAQSSKQLGDGIVGFFLPEGHSLARFVGFYRVLGMYDWQHQSASALEARKLGFLVEGNIWHDLELDTRGEELTDRMIIEWPQTGRHHQWFRGPDQIVRDRFPIREIRPRGLMRPFPGFQNVNIRYGELCGLVNSDAGGWVEALRNTRGVYLITDVEEGALYVGSATGADGIWGRWTDYARTIHGGNSLLRVGLAKGSLKRENMQFSILETLGSLATRQEGIDAEQRWKAKLGKRATVLNAN